MLTSLQKFGWKAVEKENMTMPVTAFLKLCRCKLLIPHLLSIEDLITFGVID